MKAGNTTWVPYKGYRLHARALYRILELATLSRTIIGWVKVDISGYDAWAWVSARAVVYNSGM